MRICLATNGTRGDVFPFLAIGRELTSRGHDVAVLTHPHFAQDVADAGLGFQPLAPGVDQAAILADPALFDRRRGSRIVLQWVRETLREGVDSFERMLGESEPDLLVAHSFMLGGSELAARAGVPFVNATLAPCAWLSRDDPCPAIQQRPGARRAAGARLVLGLARPLAGRLTDWWFGKAMREAGLTETRNALFGAFRGGEMNLGLWSHHFRAPCADDPPGGIITGFAWYDGKPGTALDPGLVRFCEAGEAPIVFAMGSTAHSSAAQFYELAARACERLGVRGVLLTGDPARAPAGLPESVRAFGYAPFRSLFPRASVTVHHGGIGSTAQALRAGRPTLVVPRAHDQFNNSVHVDRLGVGRALWYDKLSEDRLAEKLDELLRSADIRVRAAEMGQKLAAEDGARVAADYIETVTQARPASPGAPAPHP